MQKDLPIPFFEQPNAIVLAANNFYVPYLSTLLQSIKAHTNTSNFYDIIVLTRDISQENQQELVNQVCCNNINIRFFDVSEFISKLKGLQTPRQLTVETYYRLFMQDILAHYDVALYMDCDMICQDDVSKLFDIDIKEYHLAACRDVAIIAHYNKNCIVGFNKYVKQRLQLDDISNYFQAGLILFNLNNMRQDFVVDEILSLATTMQWQYQDQDLLNYMMSTKGKVKYLDLRWNYVRWHLFGYKDVHSAKEFVPQDIYAQYNDANQDFAVIHYAANPKPWADPQVELGQKFWIYAVQTPFYDTLISRLKKSIKKPGIRNNKKLKRFVNCFFPLGSKRRKLLMRIFFGKQKDRKDTRN